MSQAPQASEANWYVVLTKPREESRALEQLRNQEYRCFLPMLRVQKVRRGKVQVVSEPMFSRYLFIHLDDTSTSWAPIRSTRGVSKLVEFGGQPARVPEVVMAYLFEATRAQDDAKPLFEQGDAVQIVDGPLKGLTGVYQMADGEQRAMVLIELLNRAQRVSIDAVALTRAA